MRISDWSSDVCSSDLEHPHAHRVPGRPAREAHGRRQGQGPDARGAQRLHLSRCRGWSRVPHPLSDPPDAPACTGPSTTPEQVLHKVPHRLWTTRSEEHTSELQSLMRISYAVFCLKKKNEVKYIRQLS